MFATALVGCSGYAGQETLDRVLAHPELEVVALGSDSLAGEPPSALDLRLNGSLPAFVPNAEALASGADLLLLCLDHDEAAALEPPVDGVVIDLSGGHRLRDAELRAAGALSAGGPSDRESGLLRDCGVAGARAARGCDRAGGNRGRR